MPPLRTSVAGWSRAPFVRRAVAAPLLALLAAGAQAQGAPASAIQDLSRAQVEALRRQAEAPESADAYQDRYMAEGDLAASAAEAQAAEAAQPEGLRAWMLEGRVGGTRASATGVGGRQMLERGVLAEYRQQTLNHGEWLLHGEGRLATGDTGGGLGGLGWWGAAPHASGGRFTLTNLALPLGAGWLADTRVGDAYSEITSGLARQQRLFLSVSTVRGVNTRLYSRDTEWRAGWGVRGYLAGGPYPGFEASQGQVGWLGATRRLDDRWLVAGQLGLARDIPDRDIGWGGPGPLGGLRQDVSSWALAVGQGWSRGLPGDERIHWRANLLGSQARGARGSTDAQGLHLEAERRWGRYVHAAGLHLARPRLYFGDQRLFGGDQGLFWRVDYGGSRLAWGAGLDLERSRADLVGALPANRRASLSANLQYQFSRDTALGGSLSLTRTHYDATLPGFAASRHRGLYAYAYAQSRWFDWPRSRLSLTVRHHQQIVLDSATATGQELQWEQDWITGRYETQRPEFTTTLGYAWDRSSGIQRRYPTAGVQFRHWFDARGFVMGNLRYTSMQGGLATTRGLAGSVSAEYELAPGWRAGLLVSLNQARSANLPAGWIGPTVFRSQERSAYVFLRWEGQAGRPHAVIGRAEAPGSGRIIGQVFFDANGDGERQVDEAGVPQVEVVLDGRYRTRTDGEGRFEFPMVAVGRQRLTLTLDTVPLPWAPRAEAGVSVQVPLRGVAMVELPVARVQP